MEHDLVQATSFARVRLWIEDNGLVLNESKTKVMNFGLKEVKNEGFVLDELSAESTYKTYLCKIG